MAGRHNASIAEGPRLNMARPNVLVRRRAWVGTNTRDKLSAGDGGSSSAIRLQGALSAWPSCWRPLIPTGERPAILQRFRFIAGLEREGHERPALNSDDVESVKERTYYGRGQSADDGRASPYVIQSGVA
jgi:hypothetical protein